MERAISLAKHGFHPFQYARAFKMVVQQVRENHPDLACHTNNLHLDYTGHIRQNGLSPAQWDQIIKIILQLLPLILALFAVVGPTDSDVDVVAKKLAEAGHDADRHGMSLDQWLALITQILAILSQFKK